MSRVQQDQFIDDEEEEVCPLCVEEFDLSDKNFRPCPCGYRICQFCYNNIKTTMNGLCPACRRPYDDKNIEWKVISPEEMATYKADLAQQAKKKAAARQKEAQKREADSLSRKHLAGLRVVQKNLVYVTGLNPTVREDRLLETLRGEQYFGQYGKIVKIVVSKAKDTSHPQQSVGVYVTFARKEDAASCIAAVNGSQNGDRTLRAQYGTTKYCSAYLRNETCNNRNCMFLHEPGEENESFTRQDLSSMNSISTQQPAQIQASSSSRTPVPQPPPQHAPLAAAAQPMHQQDNKDSPTSPTDTGTNGPALPSTASWGSKAAQVQQPRRASQGTSGSAPSPRVSNPSPAPSVPESSITESISNIRKTGKEKDASAKVTAKPTSPKCESPTPTKASRERLKKPGVPDLDRILGALSGSKLNFIFSAAMLSDEDLEIVKNFPPLFDPQGGAKRSLRKQHDVEDRQRQEAEAQAALQAATGQEPEENPEGGSLQLGGEPEERQDMGIGQGPQNAIQPPSQQALNNSSIGLGQNLSLTDDLANLGLSGRGLTPEQQQQLLLQQFKSANPQANNLLNAFTSNQTISQGSSALSQQISGTAGHGRHASRFTFANDTASASAAVKPVGNTKLMNQQSSMMPHNTTQFNPLSQHQSMGNQFYSGGVQGPPPGLKTTGTPPVSGGGMFGQGHGFATSGLGYGANLTGRSANPNEEMMRELLRGRGGNAGGGQLPDAAKREFMFPSFPHQHPPTSTSAPAPGLLSFPYGPQPGAYQESGSQKPKKKGKKHRHANTSSSGGGVVDVADPSILQARLHQAGPMAGQGLYAGQGQDGSDLPPIEEVSQSVDALVTDARDDTVPPATHRNLEQPRRATPTIPPGFEAPASAIPASLKESARPPSRAATASVVAPAVSGVPPTPVHAAPPSVEEAISVGVPGGSKKVQNDQSAVAELKPQDFPELVKSLRSDVEKSAPDTDLPSKLQKLEVSKTSATTTKGTTPAIQEKIATPTVATQVPEAKGEASTVAMPVTESIEEKPKAVAQETNAAVEHRLTASKPKTTTEKATAPKSVSGPDRTVEAVTSPPASSTAKRQPPGKLDIAAATKTLVKEQETASTGSAPTKPDTPPKVGVTPLMSTAITSHPETPATTSTESPMKRTAQPKVIRVLPTPKPETPPPVSTTSTAAPPIPPPPVANKRLSRQPSITSINLPATPVSELISDNASITSTSISRASSPPPGSRVGSAPIKKSKSQAKKDRQERTRQIEEEKAIAGSETQQRAEETVQAPIVGRKKKTKKPTTSATTTSTPAASRPASPGPKEKTTPVEKAEEPVAPAPPKETKPATPKPTEDKNPPTPDPAQPPKPPLTAASILRDLEAANALLLSHLEFLKPTAALSTHHTPAFSKDDLAAAAAADKHALTPAELAALAAHQPVRWDAGDGRLAGRVLVTPAGKRLKGLARELEDRYLALEAAVAGTGGVGRWNPGGRKGRGGGGDAVAGVGGRGLEQLFGKGEGKGAAAVGEARDAKQVKRYADEVLNYINQFVMEPESGIAGAVAVGNAGIASGFGYVGGGQEAGGDGPFNGNGVVGSGLGTNGKGVPGAVLGVEEAEEAMLKSRKETEQLEKRLNALIKRNRRLALGGGH